MKLSKLFSNKSEMNDFINQPNIKVIGIWTATEKDVEYQIENNGNIENMVAGVSCFISYENTFNNTFKIKIQNERNYLKRNYTTYAV